MRECFICGTTQNIQKHHVFHGTANRKLSEKYKMTVDLCMNDHTRQNGVHNNSELDNRLKQQFQQQFEKQHGHEKFMQVFGRNYLGV